jgi:hypothetical protein
MRRHLAIALAVVFALPVATASAADRCPRRPGEHRLARSAQAAVFERTVAAGQPFPRQILIGCSRRTGRRRVIDVLQRRSEDDPTKLVGLRLTGTRVAYVRGFDAPERTSVVADDAVFAGRRHDLGIPWPGIYSFWSPDGAAAWAVDAAGDVAWIANGYGGGDRLYVWRAGLGRRLVDSRAGLQGLTLADGLLRWRRNGNLRSVDLATVPGSACRGKATIGNLHVDLSGDDFTGTVCLRATGRSAEVGSTSVSSGLTDINGPYLVFGWTYHALSDSYLLDLVHDSGGGRLVPGDGAFRSAGVDDAVVDEHGSLAWLRHDTLWVRDATGTRAVPGVGTGARLLRDGSTVTWPGGGPTVTLDP